VSARRRLVALAVVVLVLMGTFVVVLVRSRTPECGVVIQHPDLPAALRALGDFEQAYTAADFPTLEDAAARAASAEDPNLIGTSAGSPVLVAGTGAAPDVLVVPLRGPAPAAATAEAPPIAALVTFARDCQGNAFFQLVEDDVTLQPPLSQFPPVSRATAAAELGAAVVRLQYTSSPLWPEWAPTASTSPVIPAR
jgi:hypothetical protein